MKREREKNDYFVMKETTYKTFKFNSDYSFVFEIKYSVVGEFWKCVYAYFEATFSMDEAKI